MSAGHDNCFISASAGTGKTFALTTRIIRLLLRGAEPRAIVALTFSRAAAGEIFNKLASRLADAAAGGSEAGKLSGEVFADLPPEQAAEIRRHTGRAGPLASGDFAALLRTLVATQHQSLIGTIDGFMWRMARLFPFELGIDGSSSVMDEQDAAREKNAAISSLLNAATGTGAQDFFEAFLAATQGKEGKTFIGKLTDFVDGWHERWLDFPGDRSGWGDENAIWGAGGAPFKKRGEPRELAQTFQHAIAGRDWGHKSIAPGLSAFVSFALNFDGVTFSDAPGVFEKLLEAWSPAGRAVAPFSYYKREIALDADASATASDLLETLFAIALKNRLGHTRGFDRLMARFEAAYDAATRSRGLLVFADIPRIVAGLGEGRRRDIEFRFDTRFEHWLLDEFQDTSHAQWDVLRPLVDEPLQLRDGRSVFIVGDAKQSIYGWRGGDVAIFEREPARTPGGYEKKSLTRSWRYGPKIAEAVNTVFSATAIGHFLAGAGAAARWAAVWQAHESAVTHFEGQIAVRTVQKNHGGRHPGAQDFAGSILEELQRNMPWRKGVATAILVRAGKDGEAIAEQLRAAKVPAAWEGESAISDTPVVAALLDLLLLSAHPSDTFAARHLAATPLAEIFPEIHGATGADPVARELAGKIARHGLARTLGDCVEKIKAMPGMAGAAFARARLDDLLRAAADFETTAAPDARADDFVEFVNGRKRRDFADPRTVKILTIHRSKGLGFDYVILPLIETQGMDRPRGLHEKPLAGENDGGAWLLENPTETVSQKDAVLNAAAERARQAAIFEALCTNYVAMTRAKKYLSILAREPSGDGGAAYFSGHVASLLKDYPQQFDLDETAGADENDGHAAAGGKAAGAGLIALPARPVRRMPSSGAHERAGLFASGHFPGAGAGETGVERGMRLHAALEKIEWIDDDAQPAGVARGDIDLTKASAFRGALRKPASGFVALWRERAFEVLCPDGTGGENTGASGWISGRFDRVVFFDDNDGARRAVIYDYKTNARRENTGETPAQFESRMADEYKSQMRDYRRAAAALAHLPEERVQTKLLLTATATVVELF